MYDILIYKPYAIIQLGFYIHVAYVDDDILK
jgi:hypothetical protein